MMSILPNTDNSVPASNAVPAAQVDTWQRIELLISGNENTFNPDAALEIANQAVVQNPKDSRGYLWRGKVHAASDWDDIHVQAALADFDKVSQLNPKSVEPYIARATLNKTRKHLMLAGGD